MLGSDRFQFETPNVIDPGDLPPTQPLRSHRGRNGSGDRSPTSSTHSVSTNSSSDDADSNDDSRGEYQQERSSSARLLNDINDLDLSPSTVPSRRTHRVDLEQQDAYEYGETNDDDDDDGRGMSLPSVEEARSYAASLLDNAEKRDQPRQPSMHRRTNSSNGGSSHFVNGNGSSPSSSKQLGLDRTVQLNAGGGNGGSSANPFTSHDFNFNNRSKHLVFRRVAVLASKIFLVVVLVITGVLICMALVNSRKQAKSNNNASVSGGVSFVPGAVPQSPSPNGDSNEDEPSSLTRLESIVSFLSAGQVSSVHDLTTPGTPQYMAAHWMATDDVLQYKVPTEVQDDPDVFVQRYVLATLYYSLAGETWTSPLNFLTAESECAWFEQEQVVGFIDESYAIGVTCDFPSLKVVNLFIPSNNLKGSLPAAELRHLSSLTMLALPMNQITGAIPDDLQYLSQLNYLDLKYNQLEGPVPEFIGTMSRLEVLGLSNNKLSGDIPAASWSQLSRLHTLALDDNENLSGSLGFANHLVSLEFFYVNGNKFSDAIDDNFLAAASKLKEVDISNNDLTLTTGSTFPVHLLQHPTLSVLDAAGNQLEGLLPAVLPKQNNLLEFLSLRNNRLTGPITANNLPMLTALTHLDLQGNGLNGPLPNELVNLRKLTYFFIGHNPLTVPQMPSWLYELTELRELSMPSLDMGLGLPFWLENLQNLVLLDLSNNALQGEIPAEVFNLPSLRFLLLNDNNLNGVVPQGLPNIPQLMILALHKNQLVGDMNHICDQAQSLQLLGTDCATDIICSDSCCPTCCAAEETLCFIETIPHFLTWYDGMWEFGYKRAPFSYDPAILDESNYFSTLQDVPNQNHDYGDSTTTGTTATVNPPTNGGSTP